MAATDVAASSSTSSWSAAPKAKQQRRRPKHTSYRAVVVFLLPRAADDGVTPAVAQRLEKLDEIREKWDAAAPRWVPHITLIPPFVVPFDEDDGAQPSPSSPSNASDSQTVQPTPPGTTHEAAYATLRQLTERIQAAVAAVPRHRLALDDVGVFKLSRYWNVHLRPRPGQQDSGSDRREDSGQEPTSSAATSAPRVDAESGRCSFIEMQRVLQEASPETRVMETGSSRGRGRGRGGSRGGGQGSRRERPFAPHASLGQAYDKEQLEELKALGLSLCGRHQVTATSLDAAAAALTLQGAATSGPADKKGDGEEAQGIDVEVASIALMAKPEGREGAYDVFSKIDLG